MTTRDEIYAKFGVTAEPRHLAHDRRWERHHRSIVVSFSFRYRIPTAAI